MRYSFDHGLLGLYGSWMVASTQPCAAASRQQHHSLGKSGSSTLPFADMQTEPARRVGSRLPAFVISMHNYMVKKKVPKDGHPVAKYAHPVKKACMHCK